jgi:hypothetical protein
MFFLLIFLLDENLNFSYLIYTFILVVIFYGKLYLILFIFLMG